MRILDPVYGPSLVDHPLLVDLMDCPCLRRLAAIDQGGLSRVWFPGTGFSRLEHSVGVMLLLGRFGASLEEQAAGLIHDVSHSAFSHCIDYALDEGSETEQSLQDDMHRRRVLDSELPGVLARHGLDVEQVLDEADFPLLERELPDLCADRIDYSLRMAVHARVMDPAAALGILDGLEASSGRWVFAGVQAARAYAELFADLNQRFFAGPTSAAMFRTVGDCLRHALARGHLRREDLWGRDDDVLDVLRSRLDQDPELARLWRRMQGRVEVAVGDGPGHVLVRCKSRAVDPFVNGGAGPARLSALQPDWARALAVQSRPATWRLVFGDQAD